MDFQGRLARARLALNHYHLDALLVTHLPNIHYLCGFTGSAGLLIISQNAGYVFFTDGRYTQQASEEVKGATVKIRSGKSAQAAATDWMAERKSWKRIGIDAAHLTIAERNAFALRLHGKTKLVSTPPVIEQMRMIKDPAEIAKIRAACHLGVKLFDHLLQVARPGITEIEVAGELEFAARRLGADQMSFPTIIAGGRRAALPHGRASKAFLPLKGFVVCDFGVILSGYCSDMTRTFHLGRPSNSARLAYEAVRIAQQSAVEAVKPGVKSGDVDEAARKSLQERGLGGFFTHSTGHGVGLEIHEAPRIAAGQKERLRPGTVVTVEPGVYLPGKFGIRIEDTVAVTERGCEILTPCSKELIVV